MPGSESQGFFRIIVLGAQPKEKLKHAAHAAKIAIFNLPFITVTVP